MNWIERFIYGIKHLIYGSTTHFKILQDSCALRGKSYVPILSKVLEYPTQIIAIEFLMEKDTLVMYRFIADGKEIFPFGDENIVENGTNRSLIPVDIAAGVYFQVEVRGIDAGQKQVIILNELNIIERR